MGREDDAEAGGHACDHVPAGYLDDGDRRVEPGEQAEAEEGGLRVGSFFS
jgi:hypothetical protein